MAQRARVSGAPVGWSGIKGGLSSGIKPAARPAPAFKEAREKAGFGYAGINGNTSKQPFRMVRCGGTNDKPYADLMHD
jgi:hypothetical protein